MRIFSRSAPVAAPRALVGAIENAWLPERVEQHGSRFAIGPGKLVARHPVTPLRQR
jgi:hypothetical protein